MRVARVKERPSLDGPGTAVRCSECGHNFAVVGRIPDAIGCPKCGKLTPIPRARIEEE